MPEEMDQLKQKMIPQGKVHPVIFVVCGMVLALILGWFVYQGFSYVDTDDAYIEGRIVAISPKVSAHVERLLIDDNQSVKAGSLLLELDSRDFKLKAAMAKADFEAAQVEKQEAKRDVQRYEALVKKEEISRQQFDKAQLRFHTAVARLASTQAALNQADLNVSYTKIYAPVDGHVTKRSIEQGTFVLAGQPLMAIVPDEMWVIANF
ncbi:MAG: HlyD family secretion protein, partial [Candidatus Omnitrophica bacterium]|nr:HlyD family secretion protein [Candidatus Omnitrophota bacterium]